MPLNFEMAATERDARHRPRDPKPHAACLVPEKRAERTTEGGLDVVGGHAHLVPFVAELTRAGIRVSLFIEPSLEAVEAARAIAAPVVELHTGAWCEAVLAGEPGQAPRRIRAHPKRPPPRTPSSASNATPAMASTFDTARTIAALPEIVELNIGHFLIGEAVFTGLAGGSPHHARRDGRRPRRCMSSGPCGTDQR